jgi:hypothetical protein
VQSSYYPSSHHLCVISTVNYEFGAVEMRAAQKPTAVTTNPTENSLHCVYVCVLRVSEERRAHTHTQYNRIGTVSLKVNHNKLQCIISVGSPTSRIIRERSQSARTSVFSFQKRRPPRLKSSPAQIINKDCGHLSGRE